MAYLNTTTAHRNSLAATAASTFEKLAERFKRRRLYRETFNGLSALDNRELEDLGLHRAELHTIAWESAQNAKI